MILNQENYPKQEINLLKNQKLQMLLKELLQRLVKIKTKVSPLKIRS